MGIQFDADDVVVFLLEKLKKVDTLYMARIEVLRTAD